MDGWVVNATSREAQEEEVNTAVWPIMDTDGAHWVILRKGVARQPQAQEGRKEGREGGREGGREEGREEGRRKV